MPISSAYLAISYPFLAVILYSVQKFYLRTSRQLRLLDLEAKSPLYTHFMDTVRGITTLRAFGYISDEVSKNVRLLNRSQQPAYLLAMVQEWLNLVLDMIVMLLAAVLTILAVRLHSNSGFTGASLVTLMSFGESLSGIVIYYTRLETSIGAISRLKTFNATVKPEGKEGEEMVPPENWPQHGNVELNNISASYHGDEPDLALDNVCLSIRPGEKVAICGRTGSGKSSLVSLLLKLLDPLPDTPDEGMLIDGLPLNRLDRDVLRQRVIAVPQEAVFLPDGATFKENLDPSGLSTPDECKTVLTDIGLWDFVQGRGGIDAGMTSSTLSGGQRQLMSMGRSLLRRRARAQKTTGPGSMAGKMEDQGGLLLLDEVNSSVDQDMELIIKRIIETEFDAYTVIAVSHRLDMVMDFDTVVVLDTGKLVEVGNPRVLASTEGSRFASLSILPETVRLSCHGVIPPPKSLKFGYEAAGVVRRVGSNVTKLRPGDRSVFVGGDTFSTVVRVPELLAQKLPDDISFVEASTIPAVFLTAVYGLIDLGRPTRGQSVLIHSGCCGVGLAAIRVARMLGAEIYTTVGSEAKVEYLNKTYDIPRSHIFNSRDASFATDLLQETGDKGIDVALNSLSGELLHTTWKCVAKWGTMAEIGKRDLHENAQLDMSPFWQNRNYCCLDVDQMRAELPEVIDRILSFVMNCFSNRILKPIRVDQVFPGSAVLDAFRHMQQGKHMGKIVLEIRDAAGK
ncbi:multidrug resistance-associated 1, partial [Fusarium globosum]